ncbi:MAG: hypothetical protein H7A23_26940 [Leptospiraceae bacterium]|nr:hypothetical protein [Leptospiraceae bacterium]MCP5498208.1 hypothetical protein [Leptospiraceae bacterium]
MVFLFVAFCGTTEKLPNPSLADLNALSAPPMQRMATELLKSLPKEELSDKKKVTNPFRKFYLWVFPPIVKEKTYRIIVLSFTTISGKEHKLGNILAEKLTTELAKSTNMKVLDRLMYSPELEKNDLSLNGGVVLEDLKKIGKLFSLDAIVTGIVSNNVNGLDINCRMIDPKTGYIIGAEEVFYPLNQ